MSRKINMILANSMGASKIKWIENNRQTVFSLCVFLPFLMDRWPRYLTIPVTYITLVEEIASMISC
jgi:hypothetical protein